MTTAPTTARGYIDDNIYLTNGTGQLIDMVMETVPELFWPYSIRTYARMRHDTQLNAVLQAYKLPIRRASWGIDGTDCRPEVTALVADDLGLPIIGQDTQPSGLKRRRFQWAEHLRLSLLDLDFGHMPFERIYDMSSGQARIAGVYERMPQTVNMIRLDPTEGAIEEIKQHFTPNPNTPGIQANALIWYAHDREGTNWVGQSLLRPSWAFWLLKHETMRVHATSIRRFGMGVPSVEAPAGATPGQVAEAQRLASSIRAGDSAGAGLPQGFKFALTGLTGSAPDALAFIQYLDKQMTRSTLTSLLDLADTTHGSRALGETFMDLFLLALQTIAEAHADQATKQLIVPLVDLNWGEDEPAPKIVCGDVGAQHEVTAQTMMLLVNSGAISADPALEEYLRREYKLPDRAIPWVAPAQRGQQAPQTDPVTGLPVNDPTAPDQGNVAAKTREVRAAPADQFPRQPNGHEIAAQTDFTAILAAHAAALAALVAAWSTITAAWRTQILEQIAAAPDLATLGALTVDTATATTLLAGQMEAFATAAAERQATEAAAQGVTIAAGAIDTARIDATAQAFAEIIANSYTQSAARSALAEWGPDATAADVVDSVGTALDTLTEASLADSLSGALSVAQNEGRAATLDNDPGTVKAFYAASEIMDKATCDPCRAIDEHIFPNLAEAKAAYPQGGFLDCLGRLRCRGIIVTLWSDELELAA